LKYVLFASALAVACPTLVEVFPDPTDVPDQQGEFVEIRLDSSLEADTLLVQLDDKSPLKIPYPDGDRLLLSHGKNLCPEVRGLACGDLEKISLPNSRESKWMVRAGACADSVVLDKPKPGKSFQRIALGDRWALDEPTPGYGNPLYELDLDNCGFSLVEYEFLQDHWRVSGKVRGCKGVQLVFRYRDVMRDGGWKNDSLQVGENFSITLAAPRPLRLQLELPEDGIPFDNRVDTLLAVQGNSPLLLTEVHHCPQEPEPEWIEVYNGAKASFPLSKVGLCGKGGFWGTDEDSIASYQSILVSRDTAALREFVGFRDVRLVQASIGFLNNTAGSLSLCYGENPVDSIGWEKSTVGCPMGFNPKTGKAENTPGFQGVHNSAVGEEPLRYRLSTRVLRKRGEPLRVKVESEQEVVINLLDSAGRQVWKQKAPAMSNAWWDVPVQQKVGIGAAYIRFSAGTFERVVGIVVRP
jgi:hypothetical protein